MKPTLTHPSWGQIDKACAILAARVISSLGEPNQSPEVVVGLARGGLVPAVIISHILGTKMFPISYSSALGNGEYKNYENELPEIPFTRLLFIDDIIDTGHTMKEVLDYYRSMNHIVKVASLYYREGAAINPDFVWQSISAQDPWIIFPWEI